MSNFLRFVSPYKQQGMWVFDDEQYDLVKEPFVFGSEVVLERLVSEIQGAEEGFILLFAEKPFPGCQTKFDWLREECNGYWYLEYSTGQEGWIGPAMMNYFKVPPKEIFVLASTRG